MKSSSLGGIMRRHWTVLVAVVVVTVVAFAMDRLHGIFGSNFTVTRSGSNALDNSNFNPKHVLFEVFGSPGSVATINFMDEHAQPQRVTDVTLPWSHVLTTEDPVLFADLRAQGSGDWIGCRITANGVVKDERSINAVNGYISCLDKSA